MKRLFVSVPMKNRSKEDIRYTIEKAAKVAEDIFGEPLEVIDTWIDEEPPEGTANASIWYLGESVKLISKADYAILPIDCSFNSGCLIEKEVIKEYYIPYFEIDMHNTYFQPDLNIDNFCGF